MTTPVATNLVWPKLRRLAACLCTLVEDSALDSLCSCGVQPGAAVAYDFISSGCDGADGMGWVRLSNAFVTRSFPQPLLTAQPCEAELAFSVDIGIVRTMPLGEDGEAVDAAMFEAAAERQVTEMAVMRRAVTCCFGSGAIIGLYTPVGPDGGAIGGYWTATIPTLDDDDDD